MKILGGEHVSLAVQCLQYVHLCVHPYMPICLRTVCSRLISFGGTQVGHDRPRNALSRHATSHQQSLHR
jgi:hypothetical protein